MRIDLSVILRRIARRLLDYWVVALSAMLALLGPPANSVTEYGQQAVAPNCEGRSGRLDNASVTLDDGSQMTVRLPANFDPRIAHPLLVVLPPAAMDRVSSERFYGVTSLATRAGFVVVYASARPLSRRLIESRANIAETVARRWCVDLDRVVLLGHSDGATTAYGMALRNVDGPPYRVLVASGAGINGEDLERELCPAVGNILIVHGSRDRLLPGFGEQAFAWWGRCSQCSGAEASRVPGIGACQKAIGCARPVVLQYCATDADHAAIPRFSDETFTYLRSILSGIGQNEEP